MGKIGKRNATDRPLRRSLTLLEVLIVLLLVGLLSAGGLVLGQKARATSLLSSETRRLLSKVQRGRLEAIASGRPVGLRLVKDPRGWRGTYEGVQVVPASFRLRTEQILLNQKPAESVYLEVDEHGQLIHPAIELTLGAQKILVNLSTDHHGSS